MTAIETFLKFSLWAAISPVFPPFCILFAPAAVSFFWARRQQQPMRRQLWRPVHWLVLTHLLFFSAAVLIGVRYPYDRSARAIHHPADQVLKALFYGSLVSCVFWVWRMKGFRWFASSLMALIECPVLGALFLAGMSVTGFWL